MKEEHLGEEQIIVSIVDENDLPEKKRRHLESCPACRETRGELLDQLQKMGHMAMTLAPRPPTIRLPEPKASWGLSFRWPVVASALASLLIIAAVWSLMLFRGSRIEIPPGTPGQQIVGLSSIDDILEESVLPPYYQDMALISFEYFDDDFMDFVVPLEGTDESMWEETSFIYHIEQKEA
jgi:hypothetical protein